MRYIDVSDDTARELIAKRSVNRKLVVLHTTEGYNSLRWLQNDSRLTGKPASCDYLIDRMGNIRQIGRPGMYTYHTGPARWRYIQDPDYTLNQSAVGVEFEAYESRGQRITDLQYIAGAALFRALLSYHTLITDPFVTHAMVALPPGRKTDPRSIDWQVMAREMMSPSVEASQLVIPAVLP